MTAMTGSTYDTLRVAAIVLSNSAQEGYHTRPFNNFTVCCFWE
jgi:hypothetical protein